MGKKYYANTSHILALCHILDDFIEFDKNLILVLSSGLNKDLPYFLMNLSKVNFRLGARTAKKFYANNKNVVDIINKYSNITRFIIDNYGYYGVPKESLHFFYHYILEHKDEVYKIILALEKMKELGFDEFYFEEELDFTKEVYEIYPSFGHNSYINYVANVEVIPNYLKDVIYRTENSNYKMKLRVSGDKICTYRREITLNSLVIDVNSFPSNVDKESTFEYILGLKDKQKEQSAIIRNSVDLGISIFDLDYQLVSTSDIISRLDGVDNKTQLLEVLLSIKASVEKLKTLSDEYDSGVLDKNSLLTPEILEREKTLYLRRRDWSRLHID